MSDGDITSRDEAESLAGVQPHRPGMRSNGFLGGLEEQARCDECGLPGELCNAWVDARNSAEAWLRSRGVPGLDAKRLAGELVPDVRKQIAQKYAK